MYQYLFSKNCSSYDRDNFDAFLKKVSFSYNVPSIHVGGSNGKGQTSSFIASIYKEAGFKVGLYLSPYAFKPIETIQINDISIPEDKFFSYIEKYKKLFDKYNLTEFEIETFIALTYFNEEKCDIAIIECGMGGEIDATNIFDSILSIITSVSLEHTSVLGRSLGEIAEHKAGIIKDNSIVLIDEFHPEAMSIFAKRAEEGESKIVLVGKSHNVSLLEDGYHFDYDAFKDIIIKRKSLATLKDATFAVEATLLLKNRFNITEENIKSGLLNNNISARLETFRKYPNIIVDGAHNPEAIRYLISDIENISNGRNVHVIFASFKDKNISNMLPTLSIVSNDIILSEFDHPRCRKMEDYFLYLDEYKYEVDFIKAIKNILKENPEDIILVTGSLAFAYLVSDLIKKGELDHE